MNKTASNRRILFVGNTRSAFVKRDFEILSRNYDVTLLEPPNNVKDWMKYAISTKNEVKMHDLVFGWFAGWHTLPAVHYAKRYRKKTIIVIGGYDAAYVPEIRYGAFTNFKEKIPAKYVMENADLLLAVSEFTKKEILKRVRPRRVEVVYNGVDTDKFQLSLNKDNNLVVTVSVLKWKNLKRKGIETFVRAAKYVPDARFVVIGKFKDDSINYLKQISPENVIFTGYVSDKELVMWMQKAKVICQLSYYEAFGLAPAEGMACGCIPVVTRERSGAPEFVRDLGFYVPYGDPEETAKAINMARQADSTNSLAARKIIEKEFSLKIREKKIIELIEGIFSGERI